MGSLEQHGSMERAQSQATAQGESGSEDQRTLTPAAAMAAGELAMPEGSAPALSAVGVALGAKPPLIK